MSYRSDRAWSDQFSPAITRIVGPHLLVPSPFEVDTEQAADLIVMKGRDMTIAARVRRHGYADRYPYEFTVRSRRESGQETELSKITNGWADWMFYGHAGPDEGSISRWFLIDLHGLRAAMIRDGLRRKRTVRWCEKANGDGTHFVAFDLRSFAPSIVIADG